MSHFNAGNIWGKVTKLAEKKTRDKGTSFLELEIDCANQEYGNGRAFGRLWGKEKIAAFLTYHADHKDDLIRLKGFYEQYEEHGVHYSSYTLYDFVPSKPADLPRAAFILVGDLVKKELVEGEPLLHIDLIRTGRDFDKEQHLRIWLFDPMPYYEIEPGQLIEVRGLIRKREAEDLYGGTSDDPIRPYAMTVRTRVRR